ncbi:response regulator [Desulfurivibrio dismutans]|uniref:response regulator n=1 Tax=Desulfurivibrio dismutans TaxID=1398908 RepID=UPI0023DB1A45|nr:response regulator [Desulfurivibrio alkaliphilus]MDF1615309.1 response regulator [Desulfurivibrio alkaliphilus]
MKRVLIVDDDQGFLLSLQDMCRDHADQFEIVTAQNGKEALERLAEKPVHLLVTDLKMPEMDGFELIGRLSKRGVIIPVIAMTAYGTPEMEDRLMTMGAFQYIEKPIDFNLLLKKILDGLAAGAKGRVTGISLPSFLQLLEMDRKTCTITVKSGRHYGMLCFENGELLNAFTEPLEGLEAAFEIINWDQGEIEIYNFCRNRKRTINEPLGFILLEAARFSDEKTEREAVAAGKKQPEEDLDPPPANLPSAPDLPEPSGLSSIGAEMETLLNATPGINRMVLVTNGGSTIIRKNVDNREFRPFISYVVITADKLRKAMGYQELPRHIILSQDRGGKLLIIPGPEVTLGLEVDPEVSPVKISAALAPAIAAAKIGHTA